MYLPITPVAPKTSTFLGISDAIADYKLPRQFIRDVFKFKDNAIRVEVMFDMYLGRACQSGDAELAGTARSVSNRVRSDGLLSRGDQKLLV